MSLKVIILAAGQGTRMQSHLPKVLHPLAGKPLLGHVIDTARRLQPETIIVVHGHGGEQVKQAFRAQEDVSWVLQAQQLGTGHAVQQAVEHIQDYDHVLVLYGDVPLIETASLHALLEKVSEQAIALLSVMLDEPKGYGRIIRDSEGHVTAIIEEKDANQVQRAIQEINTGIMAFRGQQLKSLLSGLSTDNAQGEYYLTDTIAAAHRQGIHVYALAALSQSEVMGVNDRRQLAQLERIKQMQLSEKLMLQGVTLADPHRLDIRGEVSSGRDVIIDIDVILEGRVVIEEGVYIGPFCYIKDAHIGKGSVIHSHSVIENSHVGQACQIGPYARLRPGTAMQAQAKVGNFVEIKKTTLGKGSKVNHLSYIGDASVGDNVNIGAGTITCNYDGANKYQTRIEDEAFIGSNTALVAPVSIGAGATIGAGSTITKDVPAHSLAVARNKQNINTHWKRPTKRS